ncbi:MAG TPA: PAS domain S-box protein [Pseudomonadales bacterium]|nr:PAS domain S-box protein [Pseudomonadales bacterium]
MKLINKRLFVQWVLMAASFGLVCYAYIVTQQWQRELIVSRAYLSALAEQSKALVWVEVDAETHKIIGWSLGAQKMLGYTHAEAIGQSIDMLVPDAFREKHHHAFDKAIETGEFSHAGTTQIIHCAAQMKNGELVEVIIVTRMVEVEGSILFFSLIERAADVHFKTIPLAGL